MIIDIPRNSEWVQTNDGDYTGTILTSRNLDLLNKPGKVRPSNKALVTSRSSFGINSPQGLPVSFTRARNATGDNQWWCLAGDKLYSADDINDEWYVDGGTLPATFDGTLDDIKSFRASERLFVASGINLHKYVVSTSTWSVISAGLDPNEDLRLLEIFDDRLYVLQNNWIYSMSSSEVLATSGAFTFSLPTGIRGLYDCTALRATSTGLWLGLSSQMGGPGRMIFWDGKEADTSLVDIEINASTIVGITIKNDVPYILDNNLMLSRWNGSFFEFVTSFYTDDTVLYNATETKVHTRFIHPNGMQTVGEEILMNISNRPSDTTELLPNRISSGVWAYNDKRGLYHKYSLTTDSDNGVDNKDVGQVYLPSVGALLQLSPQFSSVSPNELTVKEQYADILVGYSYQSDNSTEVYAIAVNDKKGQRDTDAVTAGIIILPQIQASEVQEQWQKFYTFIRPFRNSTDKIVVKYRKQEYIPVEVEITWVDTTSFTTTDTDFADILTNFDNGVDYEVEGLQGDGAGYLSHISAISEASGTYTVTLDETITGMTTNTAKVRVDRWVKIGEFTDSEEVESYKGFSPEVVSTWIQFKIYMIGKDIQLQRVLSQSDVAEEIEN